MALLLVPAVVFATTNDPPQGPKSSSPVPLLELRGQVVCIPEEMHRLYQAGLPTNHEHIYGFNTEDGKLYTLLRTKFSEALFADPRFRAKHLLLKGRTFSGTQVFETTLIRSIRNGVVYDLYYYCDVCDIQTVAPGPCECCQGPTELVEKRLEQ
jgi:hypothetical protein